MTPRFIVARCRWCDGEHWLVKPNIVTARAIAAVAAYTTKAAADADAAARNAGDTT